MVSPPSRTQTYGEWRVRHPPPRQVALGLSCKPGERMNAIANAAQEHGSCAQISEGHHRERLRPSSRRMTPHVSM
jgi:hypothetical protein